MKKLLIVSMLIQLCSIGAFAAQEQCLAFETKTGSGFSTGYDVHCIGRPLLTFADKFQGRTKTLARVIAKMNELGFEKVQSFESGEVYFLPKGNSSDYTYLLSRGAVSGPGQYELRISNGINIHAFTLNNLTSVASKLDLQFVWRFKSPTSKISYVLFRKSGL